MYVIDKDICPQNHTCPLVKLCPVKAILQQGKLLPVIDPDICIRCGICESSCPKKAVYNIYDREKDLQNKKCL